MRRTLPQPSQNSNYKRDIITHGNAHLYIQNVNILRKYTLIKVGFLYIYAINKLEIKKVCILY